MNIRNKLETSGDWTDNTIDNKEHRYNNGEGNNCKSTQFMNNLLTPMFSYK